MVIIGVDTGGTFTDLIYKDGDGWGVYKLLSTPKNPAEAVLAGIEAVAKDQTLQVIHGSTVATNAILEKKGAKTALVTNRRFEDIIEIGRQNRTRLYDLAYRKNPPLVSRELRFGLNCRINRDGEILRDLDPEESRALAKTLADAGAESVAVCFLFAFQRPDHEKQVGDILKQAGFPVSLSHEILAEFREFERGSTTLINAYVSPKMDRYIGYISGSVGENRLRIMQSNGGSISAATAKSESVRTILSGPAGGAVGAFAIGGMAGYEKLITFDMGGTSTDVCLIDGDLPLTLESHIDDYPVKVPMIDIHTVGAGGGSIAFIDAGGSLKVGPESAGADPGPICYGKGDRITVTDANLYLGRLIPDHFLGGAMKLETGRLKAAFEKMADEIGLDPTELAEGVLSVANTAMERAIRVISVEKGFDPREFGLFSFGGAGGMHAVFLARLLKIPQVLIPKNPGILSAIGMLMADIIKDYSQTVMMRLSPGPAGADIRQGAIADMFVPLETRGADELKAEGIAADGIVLERYLDMRYQGQSYEIIVPFESDSVSRFHGLHEKTYGYANSDKAVEVVNLRLRARGMPQKPRFAPRPLEGETPLDGAFLGENPVVFEGKASPTRIVDREKLMPGNRIQGPAIVVEYTSTIVLPPEASARVDEWENLVIGTGG